LGINLTSIVNNYLFKLRKFFELNLMELAEATDGCRSRESPEATFFSTKNYTFEIALIFVSFEQKF